jgi:hypothetical protein
LGIGWSRQWVVTFFKFEQSRTHAWRARP